MRKIFLPSLFASRFAYHLPSTIASLLLVDIGLTFSLEVGIVGQISAANFLVALIASFIVGAISVRFHHKRLLMIGVILQALSAMACAVAPSFSILLLMFSLNGIGGALVMPMVMSITAQQLQRAERATAVSWITMAWPASSIFISVAVNYLANFGDWRLPFLTVLLPINIVALLFVIVGVPGLQQKSPSQAGDMFKGFTEIFIDRSAIACLIGTVFSALSIGGFVVYQAAFFRQQYQVSMDFVSLLFTGVYLCMGIGIQIAGQLMRRVGSHLVWAGAVIVAGISIILGLIVPNVWTSLIAALLVFTQLGLAFTSASNVALDQVPRFRGTFMALFTACNSLGSTLGASLGGVVLLWSTYSTLGFCLGPIGILAGIVVYLWIHEAHSLR